MNSDFLRNRPKASTNNPMTTPKTIASIGNPETFGGGLAAEVDSAVFVVVDVVGDVVVSDVGLEDVEVELVVCCCVFVVVVCARVVGDVVDAVVVVGCWLVVVVITA